jgi:hypothetical protein
VEGRGFNRWQEHYNAACVYSIPLLIRTVMSEHKWIAEDPWDDKFAELAVDRLELAAACADSSYIAGRREWILTEDPDLTGLRKHPLFKTFEARYFPTGKATPARPPYVAKLVSSQYVSQLLIHTGRRWEQTWHDRGASPNRIDVHAMLEWWCAERDAWGLVHMVAQNHRNWSSRLELINEMDSWGHQYGFEPLKVAFTPYAELQERFGSLEEAMIGIADDRLKHVEDHVPSRFGTAVNDDLRAFDHWEVALRELDASGGRPGRLRITALCDQHAALWQRFHEWVEADRDQIKPRFEGFTEQVTRTAALCARERDRWRSLRAEQALDGLMSPARTERQATPTKE